jgi:hypothetical protein
MILLDLCFSTLKLLQKCDCSIKQNLINEFNVILFFHQYITSGSIRILSFSKYSKNNLKEPIKSPLFL